MCIWQPFFLRCTMHTWMHSRWPLDSQPFGDVKRISSERLETYLRQINHRSELSENLMYLVVLVTFFFSTLKQTDHWEFSFGRGTVALLSNVLFPKSGLLMKTIIAFSKRKCSFKKKKGKRKKTTEMKWLTFSPVWFPEFFFIEFSQKCPNNLIMTTSPCFYLDI